MVIFLSYSSASSSVTQSECFGGLQLQSAVIHWSIVGVVIKCGKGEAFYDFMIKSFSRAVSLGYDLHKYFLDPISPLRWDRKAGGGWRQRNILAPGEIRCWWNLFLWKVSLYCREGFPEGWILHCEMLLLNPVRAMGAHSRFFIVRTCWDYWRQNLWKCGDLSNTVVPTSFTDFSSYSVSRNP